MTSIWMIHMTSFNKKNITAADAAAAYLILCYIIQWHNQHVRTGNPSDWIYFLQQISTIGKKIHIDVIST